MVLNVLCWYRSSVGTWITLKGCVRSTFMHRKEVTFEYLKEMCLKSAL